LDGNPIFAKYDIQRDGGDKNFFHNIIPNIIAFYYRVFACLM